MSSSAPIPTSPRCSGACAARAGWRSRSAQRSPISRRSTTGRVPASTPISSPTPSRSRRSGASPGRRPRSIACTASPGRSSWCHGRRRCRGGHSACRRRERRARLGRGLGRRRCGRSGSGRALGGARDAGRLPLRAQRRALRGASVALRGRAARSRRGLHGPDARVDGRRGRARALDLRADRPRSHDARLRRRLVRLGARPHPAQRRRAAPLRARRRRRLAKRARAELERALDRARRPDPRFADLPSAASFVLATAQRHRNGG